MATVVIAGLRVEIDERDRAAFRGDLARILHKYGDHPHTRRQRDAEIKRALGMFIENCVSVSIETK